MANNIEKVDLIQKMLDKAMVQGAVTGFMEANAGPVKYSGGDEIKIPSIAMDGLKDYDRQRDAGLSDREADAGPRHRLYRG